MKAYISTWKRTLSLEKASHNWPPNLKCIKISKRTIGKFEKKEAEIKQASLNIKHPSLG